VKRVIASEAKQSPPVRRRLLRRYAPRNDKNDILLSSNTQRGDYLQANIGEKECL